MPPGQRKEAIKVYLRPHLLEWYIAKGKADNLTQALENLAKELGYKEEPKPNKARKRLHLDNEPLTCTDAVI